mgnify:CR=1 FL=1
MTLSEAIKLIKRTKDFSLRIRLPEWEEDAFIYLMDDRLYRGEAYSHKIYYYPTVLDIMRDDWEVHKANEADEEDNDISVMVHEPEPGVYEGMILIATPAFDRPCKAIERLVEISREYDLGFDIDDLDTDKLIKLVEKKI